ncbi:MAG: diacylglycerol kinase family protein, partial [bacterium]
PHARAGAGIKKWEVARRRLLEFGMLQNAEPVTEPKDLHQAILRECDRGDSRIVAVGGDGTVGQVVNTLMSLPRSMRDKLILGAIGMGSSNDFHKPYKPSDCIVPGVPVRLCWSRPQERNVGQVDFWDTDDQWHRRYFVINGSLGVLAAANHFFNNPRGLLTWLKPRFLNLSIWYAGLRTVMTQPAFEGSISENSKRLHTKITNLSVLLSPHVSGGFSLDIPVSPTSSTFGIALCEDMTKLRRLCTFMAMAHGRFVGLPGTRAMQAAEVSVSMRRPVPLELDGEVFMAARVHMRLLQGAIRVCSRENH